MTDAFTLACAIVDPRQDLPEPDGFERAMSADLTAEMLECLEGALEFVSAFEDVSDGPYGEPVPNTAMQLAHVMRLVIAKARATQ